MKLKSCKITVIWNVTPHTLAERHQYFGGIAVSIFRQTTTKMEPAGSYNTLPTTPPLHLPDNTALHTHLTVKSSCDKSSVYIIARKSTAKKN